MGLLGWDRFGLSRWLGLDLLGWGCFGDFGLDLLGWVGFGDVGLDLLD